MKADRVFRTFRVARKVQALKRTNPERFQTHFDRFSRVANNESPFQSDKSYQFFETPLGAVRVL